MDGVAVYERGVRPYTFTEAKQDGNDFVVSWEVMWEDSGICDLGVFRFGLELSQVRQLSSLALASLAKTSQGKLVFAKKKP